MKKKPTPVAFQDFYSSAKAAFTLIPRRRGEPVLGEREIRKHIEKEYKRIYRRHI